MMAAAGVRASSRGARPTRTAIDYLVIVLMIYLSGNIFFLSVYYSVTVPAVAAFVVISAFSFWFAHGFGFASRSALQLCFFGASIALMVMITQDAAISPYMAILAQMAIAAVVAEIIPVDEFVFKASQVMATLAAVSLVFFGAGLLFPSAVSIFPFTPAIASVDYYNAWIHVYAVPGSSESIRALTRNSGIFWEPGAYQAFLNIGLFFLLEDRVLERLGSRSRQTWQAVVIILAIISTFSSTGIVLLVLVLWSRRKALHRLGLRASALAVLALSALSAGIFLNLTTSDLSMVKYLADPRSAGSRVSLDKLGLLWDDVPAVLFGRSFSSSANVDSAIWNSIIQTFVVFGAIFSVVLLLCYVRGAQAVCRNWGVLLAILILSFSTESLIWRPFFLYVAFAHLSKSSSSSGSGRRRHRSRERSGRKLTEEGLDGGPAGPTSISGGDPSGSRRRTRAAGSAALSSAEAHRPQDLGKLPLGRGRGQ